MSRRIVLGVHLAARVNTAVDVQKVFTEYGCSIKTRIGLHNVSGGTCSPSGLILLETYGEEPKVREMEERLKQLPGVTVQSMVFEE